MEKSSSDFLKQEREKKAFLGFLARLGSKSQWRPDSVESRPSPQPDIFCHRLDGTPEAFELVSLTGEDVIKVQRQAVKSESGVSVDSVGDPSARIVQKKLSRQYQTEARRILLLIYCSDALVTPDDVAIATIQPILQSSHPFAEVWYEGEHEVCKIYPC